MSEVYPETPLGSPAPAPTPGQAAYEAHAATLVPRPWRWDQLDGKLRTAWEAAAQAAIATAMPPAEASPELAAAMAETRAVRDGYAQLCDYFTPSPQSGMSARISLTMLNRHRVKAGLPELSRHDARERPDPLMQALDRIDELAADVKTLEDDNAALREQLATTQAIARALQRLAIARALQRLAIEITDEVSGWSRHPLDTDELITRWRRTAGLEAPDGQ